MAFNNFPYTDAHELNLDWVIGKQKATAQKADTALTTATETKDYVNNYFDNLDVTEEINNKMDEMYENGDFNDIFDRYQKLTGDVIIITASFGKYSPRDNPNETINPFTAQCKDRIEHMGSTRKCYWNAIGGKGFAHDGFLDVIEGLEGTVDEPNKVSVIMVAGGGNDVSTPTDIIDQTDIAEGMQHFMEYVHEHYPNAIVRFAWLSWMKAYNSYRTYNAMNQVIEWYKYLCPRYDIGYCLNSEWMYHQYHSSWYLGDNYHPSTVGSTYIADGVMDCILNGSCTSSETEEIAAGNFLTRSDSNTPIVNCAEFTVRKDNNMVTIIPGNEPNMPTFQIASRLQDFIPVNYYGSTYGIASFHSDLFLSAVPRKKIVKFDMYVILEDPSDTTTGNHRTAFNATAMYYSGSLWIAIPHDSTYMLETYTQMSFFMPTVYIPTDLA